MSSTPGDFKYFCHLLLRFCNNLPIFLYNLQNHLESPHPGGFLGPNFTMESHPFVDHGFSEFTELSKKGAGEMPRSRGVQTKSTDPFSSFWTRNSMVGKKHFDARFGGFKHGRKSICSAHIAATSIKFVGFCWFPNTPGWAWRTRGPPHGTKHQCAHGFIWVHEFGFDEPDHKPGAATSFFRPWAQQALLLLPTRLSGVFAGGTVRT